MHFCPSFLFHFFRHEKCFSCELWDQQTTAETLRLIKGIRLNWNGGIRELDTKTKPKREEKTQKSYNNDTNYNESQKNTGKA